MLPSVWFTGNMVMGSAWDGVTLHSSLFGAVTKTMLVCYTVLHCVLAAAEEILQSVRACSVSHSASPLNKIGSMQEFARICPRNSVLNGKGSTLKMT